MRSILVYFLSILILLVAWQLISMGGKILFSSQPYKENALLGPLEAFGSLIEKRNEIAGHFLASIIRVVISLSLALTIAAPLGLVIGFESELDKLISPIIYVTFPIPKIVFLPLLFIFLGLGNAPKVALITLVISFLILISTRDAVKSIPEDYIISVSSTGASKLQIYRHVIIPGSLPSILTSTRISVGIAIMVLYLAETFVTRTTGLGVFINKSYEIGYFPDMYAGIAAMGLLGLILYATIDVIERVTCKWKYV